MHKVDNAIIMAAGLSSRFAPLSFEFPKGLLKVKGEILIERQIKQLKSMGINDITVVVGYKKELFSYLVDKYQVEIVENPEYSTRNNHSSLYYVRNKLRNTYICSADNYFSKNLFELQVEESFYSAVFEEETTEWCITTDKDGYINDIQIGGINSWIMMGHVFFSETFSKKFVSILEEVYDLPETYPSLWENIYIEHINELPMKVKKYEKSDIFEFDSLEDLRRFDPRFITSSGSKILEDIANTLNCEESEISSITPIKETNDVIGFNFLTPQGEYQYIYESKFLSRRVVEEDLESIKELYERIFESNSDHDLKVERLGGLTNKNYKVMDDRKSYVFRIAGDGTEELVSRGDEKKCTQLAEDIGITPHLIYFDPNSGTKITSYIDNAVTMNSSLVRNLENMKSIAKIFKKLHQSDKKSDVIFDVFQKIQDYEKLLPENILWNDYFEIKKRVISLKKLVSESNVRVLCHNDPLCENFVMSDSSMYLVDWEYSGMNDPMWDIADFFIEAEYTLDEEQQFYKYYFDSSPTSNELTRLLINKVLIDFLWSLWGLQRFSSGADLLGYANHRYEKAKKTLRLLEEEGN